jgi:YrbI family 3-deoxy-D-manno-octulosonate 8-phosphate phosphatase
VAIKIKAVITDVDGCLTNGAIYQFRSGDIARQFSTLDGRGFSLLHENGIKTAIMTSAAEEEQEIIDRANWLNVEYVYMDIRDKAKMVFGFSEEYSIPLSDIAFLGNDVNDFGAMQICGFVGCPRDAHYTIVEYCKRDALAGYVGRRLGGQGAFREFAELVIACNKSDSEIRLRRNSYMV